VRRGKALAGVVRQVSVTDASGNTVDLGELFGAEQAADGDEPSEPAEQKPAADE
jgi:trigger factor